MDGVGSRANLVPRSSSKGYLARLFPDAGDVNELSLIGRRLDRDAQRLRHVRNDFEISLHVGIDFKIPYGSDHVETDVTTQTWPI